MAEAAKKPTEAPVKKDAAADAAKPKSKLDILGLVSVVVVTANLAAVVGLGMYLKKTWSKMAELEARVEQVAHNSEDEAPVAHKEKTTGRAIAPAVQGTLYPMESFLVNITSDQGPKFLQTQMEFELTDAATEDEVTRKKAAIRDAIIVLLSSRSYKQIRETTGMVTLRHDILRAVNNLLSNGKVREVYFTQFHFN